ncbi:NAD(P)/FAD-dependent oxidoreductase [Pontimicrobium aquaticum]|uniref:FAD-dependent oxidoreductase n=1 Tax=Pontimicrobium aquaticum TaxID=2565367 RepID=A0A4V5LQX9_9FLAO|nr:FAD-dependent oxidoreductase [Pontimicrobium aquaticum]TJY37039.1 FAD-dependent oxidoreductase [Pontimicrobium aquaticum]
MKNVDYIVVGSGLAGIMFCDVLMQHNKTFVVVDDGSQKSSMVAGGLYNPVVLKRFTPVWKSKEQLELALPRYKALEKQLDVQLDYKIPVYRLFASIEEQNNWFLASDKAGLSEYIKPEIHHIKNTSIKNDFGFGKVLHTGRIDTTALINAFKNELRNNHQLIENPFDYNAVSSNQDIVNYNNIEAKHIVFAEGFGLKQNPFFNHLPLKGTKGELLTINAPKLNIDFVLKSGAFLIPLQNDNYIVGATYEWEDKTNNITETAKNELLEKLKAFINCDFEVVNQVAGMRPTVIDRRPLVGQHDTNKHLFVLNGLGTRGVMIAPYVAKQLFEYIENGIEVDSEINISRFNN